MHNHDRRIRYMLQRRVNGVTTREQAGNLLGVLYAGGCEDLPLTPAQRRRVRHHRAGEGAHRQNQRERRRAVLARRLAMWDTVRPHDEDITVVPEKHQVQPDERVLVPAAGFSGRRITLAAVKRARRAAARIRHGRQRLGADLPVNDVVVTWMDGRQETYRCEDWQVENGNLWLRPGRNSYGKADPVRCIPLGNVRIWTADR